MLWGNLQMRFQVNLFPVLTGPVVFPMFSCCSQCLKVSVSHDLFAWLFQLLIQLTLSKQSKVFKQLLDKWAEALAMVGVKPLQSLTFSMCRIKIAFQ